MKKDWQKLTYEQQKVFKDKAEYLIERSYVQGKTTDEFSVEIHMDVNTDSKHGSNCVASQAAGYALGVTGLNEDQIKLKPDAFAASFGADHFAHNLL